MKQASLWMRQMPWSMCRVRRSNGRKVAIRKKPSVNAHVLGAFEYGQRLVLFEADETGTWRKLHFRLRGGHGGLVEAWVMLQHPQLGVLVSRDVEELQAAPSPPQTNPVLDIPEEVDQAAHLAALAAEFGERLQLVQEKGLREYGIPQEFMDVRESFEVVRKPMVAVRSQPSTDGLIVFSVEFGQHVDTFGADDSGQWRRVYCQCTKAAKQDVPLPRDPVQAWIMIQHPSLGQLLRHLE
ncbi:unnamed protein product [Durusdinium trenchii]|uniref:Uncharacterized protein n=1 Tax=Durusdinium trenchii TaxID=1381693 RepID=A0ABP0I623_9DINO